MERMCLKAEHNGPGSSMLRAPMIPNSPASGGSDHLAARIDDLEWAMRLTSGNIGELRSQQTALYSWVVWFGSIRRWMTNCARTFPGE